MLEDFITLPNGSKLYLMPITQADLQGINIIVEKEFADEPIKPPTYTTKADEIFEWDKESIQLENKRERTGEELEEWNQTLEAWDKHEQALQRMAQEIDQRITRFVLTESPRLYQTKRGTEFDLTIDDLEPEWEPPQAWLKRQQSTKGYVLPDDPYERKYDFVASLINDTETMFRIVAKANSLAMKGAITDEGVSKMEATFLSQMGATLSKQEAQVIAALETVNPTSKGKE